MVLTTKRVISLLALSLLGTTWLALPSVAQAKTITAAPMGKTQAIQAAINAANPR